MDAPIYIHENEGDGRHQTESDHGGGDNPHEREEEEEAEEASCYICRRIKLVPHPSTNAMPRDNEPLRSDFYMAFSALQPISNPTKCFFFFVDAHSPALTPAV